MSKLKLNLKDEVKVGWPNYVLSCRPFIVKHKEEGFVKVCVLANEETVLFSNLGCTWNEEMDGIMKNYTFIRYLEPGESFTVTI